MDKNSEFTFKTDIKRIKPKPVMCYSDKWNKRKIVQEWYVWKDWLVESYLNNGGDFYSVPVSIDIKFYIKPRRMDLDNLIKGCIDALNKIAFEDDTIQYIQKITAETIEINQLVQYESCIITIAPHIQKMNILYN